MMNSIFSKDQLMQQAILLSSEMEIKYPEPYKFLDETPLFLSYSKDNKICSTDFQEYVATLKEQMLHHVAMHSKNYKRIY
jgi:hypothetical protein